MEKRVRIGHSAARPNPVKLGKSLSFSSLCVRGCIDLEKNDECLESGRLIRDTHGSFLAVPCYFVGVVLCVIIWPRKVENWSGVLGFACRTCECEGAWSAEALFRLYHYSFWNFDGVSVSEFCDRGSVYLSGTGSCIFVEIGVVLRVAPCRRAHMPEQVLALPSRRCWW